MDAWYFLWPQHQCTHTNIIHFKSFLITQLNVAFQSIERRKEIVRNKRSHQFQFKSNSRNKHGFLVFISVRFECDEYAISCSFGCELDLSTKIPGNKSDFHIMKCRNWFKSSFVPLCDCINLEWWASECCNQLPNDSSEIKLVVWSVICNAYLCDWEVNHLVAMSY